MNDLKPHHFQHNGCNIRPIYPNDQREVQNLEQMLEEVSRALSASDDARKAR